MMRLSTFLTLLLLAIRPWFAAADEPEKPKVLILIQSWALSDSTSPNAKNNFRMRRSEIKVSGKVSPAARWLVMIDGAKTLDPTAGRDNKVLQDAWLALGFAEAFELQAGQFKIPTTAEGLDPSSELILPERSLIARTFGDRRQPGAQLTFKSGSWKLSGMLSNGGANNTDDATTPKDFHLRAEVAPREGLSVGGFVSAGDFKFADNGRRGVNARWNGGKETLRAEWAGADPGSRGFVAEAAYRIVPEVQPVLRFERLVPYKDLDFSVRTAVLGLNYYLEKHQAKIQAAYSFLYNAAGSNGTSRELTPDAAANGRLFVLSFQAALQ